MKKIVTIMAITVLATLLLTACEGNKANEESLSLNIGETGSIGSWNVTLDSYEITDSIQTDISGSNATPEQDCVFVVANMTVVNNGEKEASFVTNIKIDDKPLGADIKIISKDNQEFSVGQIGKLYRKDELVMEMIAPASSQSGIIAFQVSTEAANAGEMELKISLDNKSIIYTL